MSVAHGCGCAPDEVIRWLVVGLLASSGAAVLVVRTWRRRRGTERTGTTPPGAPLEESGRRLAAERSATAVAGVLIVGLALFVALVPMGSDAALLVLVLGATIGTAGFGFASPRTRPGVRPRR